MKNFESYSVRRKDWLKKVPQLVEEIISRLGISEIKELPNLSYNYVASGFQEYTPIILKLSLDFDGLRQEALALKCFEHHGAVKILAQEEGFLLLEQASPGISLKSYFPHKDEESIDIICHVMNSLHQAKIPESHDFPQIKDWLKGLDRGGDIPHVFLQKAREIRNELLQTSIEPVLLHGDLHHDNILQNHDHWIIIDPKGVIGEPTYEIGAFIRNPLPEIFQHPEVINRRIHDFAKHLNLDPLRIQKWCFVQAVLAWVWALEDGLDSMTFKELTLIFDAGLS